MTAIWLPACTDNSPAAIGARTFTGAVVIVVGERREPPGEPVHDGPAGLGVSPHRLAGDLRHARGQRPLRPPPTSRPRRQRLPRQH
jgi:hypothetical protein